MDFPVTSVNNRVCPPSGSRFLGVTVSPDPAHTTCQMAERQSGETTRLEGQLWVVSAFRCGGPEATTGTLGRVRRVTHPGCSGPALPHTSALSAPPPAWKGGSFALSVSGACPRQLTQEAGA